MSVKVCINAGYVVNWFQKKYWKWTDEWNINIYVVPSILKPGSVLLPFGDQETTMWGYIVRLVVDLVLQYKENMSEKGLL